MHKFHGMLFLMVLGLIAGPVACSNSSEVSDYEAALTQAATCDEVLDAIQEDAITKVDLELKSFIEQDYYRWGGPVAFEDVAGGAGGAGGASGGPPQR